MATLLETFSAPSPALPAEHPVVVQEVRVPLRADGSVPRVTWAGELQDFTAPQPLRFLRCEGGFAYYAAEAYAPVGVYGYKLQVDGAWADDFGNPRTRGRAGHRDALLVVGGSPEPLLFAPALPFVHASDAGGAHVRAALRRGHGRELTLCFSPVAGAPREALRRVPMHLVGEEDEHLLFAVDAPFAGRTYYRFETPTGLLGDEHGAAFCFDPRAIRPPPGWWQEAVVYTVLLDRFRPSRLEGWGTDPGADRPAGGDLHGLRAALPELAALGITCLHLTPVHPAASCHRYDVHDPLEVDDALGGEAALRALLDEAHARGLRVLLDFSLLHVGAGFEPWRRLREEGEGSPWAAYFRWVEGAVPPRLQHYGKRADAPLLDLTSPPAQALVLAAAERWSELPIDGFRLDAAADVPVDLARCVRQVLRRRRPEAVVLGEVVPDHRWRFLAGGAVDAVTDFPLFHALRAFLGDGRGDAASFAAALRRAEGQRSGAATVLRFASTHDHPRIATLATAAGAPEWAALGHLVLLALPGVPALVYGEELALAAPVVGLEPEGGAWADRMPMPWPAPPPGDAYRGFLSRALAVRRERPALSRGALTVHHAEGAILVLRRALGDDVVDIVIHRGEDTVEIDLDDAERPAASVEVAFGAVALRSSTVTLGPRSGAWLRRHELPAQRAARRHRVLALAPSASAAFLRSDVAGAPRPARIDFALTEVCNLRCTHCITDAPALTASGRARTLPRFLLEALRPHLAHASYFGFVHGGETLAAGPLFFDTLAAIADARAGAPTAVHLLTNGMLLTPGMLERLVAAGVTSLSVSIDGATAATNDAIREGARLERVLQHLREAVALRNERRWDLRIGVSTVLMAENLPELSALVELAADVGVDWLKLEELVPATPLARRSLLALASGATSAAAARAVAEGARRGLVVVDHTRERALYHCRLDDDERAFLDADGFANRATPHPCRAPWEHVTVDPQGDVRLVDFHGPVLGNLAEADLRALFAGPVARSERQRSLERRLCGAGPVTCLPEAAPL